tara:strand:+ start:57 stop:245 length:189 start_codon:yes stop_codon:yes gene_type:complete
MSKLKENIKKLHKEGLLDKFFKAIEKQVKKLSDNEYQRQKKAYNKDMQKLLDKLRNESVFWK